MQICGIVAEYNPFHRGHARQIAEARKNLEPDSAVICCMSGNFVQRGGAAVLPKHLRAQAAVSCGADVVLELPVSFALRSAEGFAQSAVQILLATGVLTHLSFGAEDADPALLRNIASLLLEHRTVQDTLLELKTGISYAAARERALYARVQEQASVLQKPNNILAVEYCKALERLQADTEILPVARVGAGHDALEENELPSASLLRQMLSDGREEEALAALPEESAAILRSAMENGLALLNTDRLENEMLSRLIRLNEEDLALLPDASEGLSHRLLEAIRSERGIEDICAAAKTKRYALSRIRRLLFCAFLGIPKSESRLPPPYIRVLAFNDKGREVLRLMRKQARLPVLTKPAHVQDLSAEAQAVFSREALACDLYHLALPGWKNIPFGQDWRQNAVYVRESGK